MFNLICKRQGQKPLHTNGATIFVIYNPPRNKEGLQIINGIIVTKVLSKGYSRKASPKNDCFFFIIKEYILVYLFAGGGGGGGGLGVVLVVEVVLGGVFIIWLISCCCLNLIAASIASTERFVALDIARIFSCKVP